MHLIDIQYLMGNSKYTKDTDMHDLYSIYTKVKDTLSSVAKEYFVYGENSRFYPHKPKMSDLSVVSLAITAESLEISSESLLWSKLKTDYADEFSDLPHRATFNRRRKQLRDLILQCTDKMACAITSQTGDEELVIDSMPIPTCKIIRESRSKACRRPEHDAVLAKKGFNKILGGYFIGYKMHLITTTSGVYRDLLITSGNEHDSIFLKLLSKDDNHLRDHTLFGDRGYIGKVVQLRLYDELKLDLDVPYKINQKDFKEYSLDKKLKRRTIEVIFSEYCDEFNIRKNYAKRFNGFDIRIVTKIAAKTFKQYWNYIHGRPINQTKHALAA